MARTLDDIYRDTLWKTSINTADFPYKYTSGGAYGFLQTFHDVYTRLVREIVEQGSDHFMEKSTFNLVANQQEYVFPDDLLKLRQVELSYNGSTWARTMDRDLSFLPQMTEAATLSAANIAYPYMDILENSIFIYPEPKTAVISGGKMWYIKMPAEGMYVSAISAASATVTFPQEYEYLLPLGCAAELWGKYEAPGTNPNVLQQYATEVEKMKRQIKPRVGGGQKRMIDFREQGNWGKQ